MNIIRNLLFYHFALLNFCLLIFCNLLYSQNLVTKAAGGKKIAEGIFLLSDYGCNIVVMAGEEGIMIIDSGEKRFDFKTDSVVSTISNRTIKYILNTHQHFDHVGGNMKLAEDGAIIVAHENTRKLMLEGWKVPEIQGVKFPSILPYPTDYLPDICFRDSLNIFFNDEIIKAIHFPKAHSDCDVIFFFKKGNVIHAGDLFETNMFPIIDVYYGGTIDGYIKAVDGILKLCNDNTIIIPGHGSVSNRKFLEEYKSMLIEATKRIAMLVKVGKSADEVIAADPTKGLYKGGELYVPVSLFVATVYEDLSRKLIGQ